SRTSKSELMPAGSTNFHSAHLSGCLCLAMDHIEMPGIEAHQAILLHLDDTLHLKFIRRCLHRPFPTRQRQKLQDSQRSGIQNTRRGRSSKAFSQEMCHICLLSCLTTVKIDLHLVNIENLQSSLSIEQAF